MVSFQKRRPSGLLLGLFAAIALAILLNCRPNEPRLAWAKRWGPLVPHKSFPGDCGICHIPERWDVLREDLAFDHEKETSYPLEGAHTTATCLRCHNDRGPVGVYVARGCGGCHPDPHASSLGMDCERCHGQTSWVPTGLIAEHARTRFPLVGPHAVVPCESCHPGAPAGQFRGAPIECELCHQAELARAASPNHAASGWTTGCDRCHVPTSWRPARVDHDFFPLIGSHGGLDCTQCHTTGVFGPIPASCYACHQTDYEAAPNHLAQGYPQNCEQCHSIIAWIPATYGHTGFPLTGAHTGLNCIHCHTGGTFDPLPTDCYSCHAADYAAAPDHTALSFPQDCEQCHTTIAWTPATFQHPFPLLGPHNVSCMQCHTTGSASTFSCLDCHQHSQSAVDQAHGGVGGYSYNSQACYQCHPNGRE